MTMFCNYGHPYVPGIGSLDNFYCKQFEDGEICREIDRATGKDYDEWVNREGGGLLSRVQGLSTRSPTSGREAPQPPPHLTLDALNHPIFAWAELESFRITGDRARLALRLRTAGQVLPRSAEVPPPGQRPVHDRLGQHGQFAPQSSIWPAAARPWTPPPRWCCSPATWRRSPTLLGKKDEAKAFRAEAEELARLINEKMWDPRPQVLLRPDRGRKALAGQDDRGVLDAPGGRGRAGAGRGPRRGAAQPRRPSAESIASRPSRPTSRPSSRPEGIGRGPSGRRPTPW